MPNGFQQKNVTKQCTIIHCIVHSSHYLGILKNTFTLCSNKNFQITSIQNKISKQDVIHYCKWYRVGGKKEFKTSLIFLIMYITKTFQTGTLVFGSHFFLIYSSIHMQILWGVHSRVNNMYA